MTDGDTVTQLAVVILLLVLAVPALSTAHEFAGTPLPYDETLTVDYSNDSTVAQNATVEGYGDDPTIVVNDTELVQGTDYEWNATNGSVNWINTSNTSSGDSADISYRAYQRTQESSLSWSLLSALMGLFSIYTLVIAVRVVWNRTAEVWDL